MRLDFRNLDFFENIEAGAPFGRFSCSNFLAGANFIACGAALSYYHMTRRAVLPSRVIPIPG